ncbi:MAG: winged helix-turn-helix transcriptional regulator [Allosphingosinicella sp.]
MIDELVLRQLSAGRWLVPLLAHLDEADGSRFAIMLNRLGLSRSILSASLDALIEAGWAMRNPGHGHPLRPEYILTAPGVPVAAFCRRLMRQREQLGLGKADLARWSLPVVARLDRGRARFSALKTPLAPITPRALSLTLKQLLAQDLVGRHLEESFPPVAIYDLTGRGRELASVLR